MKELLLVTKPNSAFSEAIKTVRTNLKFSNINKKVKTIALTSSFPGEGKSFIAANLAVAFAQVNEKVLLVDCDMRRGRQHRIFGLTDRKIGLSNLLIEEDFSVSASNFICKTEVPNLFVLPMGTLPPNPSELLASEKNEMLVNLLGKAFDIIIFDCPPLVGLNDALIMSSLSDVSILVVKSKSTPIEAVEKSKKALNGVQSNLAGVILNQVEPKHKNSYYYNSYYTSSS